MSEREQAEEQRLSTADMAAAADRQTERVQSDREVPLPSTQARPTSDTGVKAPATPLLAEPEMTELRAKWVTIQTAFVDEPRSAVEQADELVASTMKRLADTFARERSNLEGQWDRGDDISTEDLRIALQRYRSFFDRLLSV